MEITAVEAFVVLDEELIESLWIEDIFGAEALDQIVDDWCRSREPVDEIAARRELAGAAAFADVVQLPIPATRGPSQGRRAAA